MIVFQTSFLCQIQFHPTEPFLPLVEVISHSVQIKIIPTMLNTTSNDFTTKYTYGNDDQEYVFSCKGRPFAVLVSSHFPTPTTTLLDYDLVKSLDLKNITP